MKKFLVIILLIYFFVYPVLAYSADIQDESFVVKKGIGESTITGSKIVKAKEAALKEALKEAYYSAVLSVVPDEVMAVDFEKVLQSMNINWSNIMEEYNIAGEKVTDLNYILAVKASFNKEKLKKVLADNGVFLQEIKLPRVLLLISQKDVEDVKSCQWWTSLENPHFCRLEESVAEKLGAMGYDIIKPFVPKVQGDQSFETDEIPDKKEAINIAVEKGAEIVIVGKAKAFPGGNRIGDQKTVRVSVSLVVFKTDTGDEIYNISEDTMHMVSLEFNNTDNAFAKAGESVGINIGEAVTGKWQKLAAGAKDIQIEVFGSNYLPRFISLKNRLVGDKIVEELQEKEITGSGSIFSVKFKGSAQELAKKMIEIPFDNFGIEITEIDDNGLKLRFVSLD